MRRLLDKRQSNVQSNIQMLRRLIFWTVGIVLTVLIAVLVFVPIDERVLARGVVRSANDTYLYAPVEGILEKVVAWEGTSVRAGDPVLQLDDTLLREELRQIDARLEQARNDLDLQIARLRRTERLPLPPQFWHIGEEIAVAGERIRQADAEAARARGLHEKGLMSAQDLERADLAADIARAEQAKLHERLRVVEQGLEGSILTEANAEIASARAAMDALNVERALCLEAIERLVIRSPEDGVVTMVNVRRPGTRIERGDDLAHIAHSERQRVDLFASEMYFHRVRIGQRVVMRSSGFDSLRFGYVEGRVVRVASEPEENPAEPGDGGPVFRVVADIESTPQPLPLGSTVEAKIIIRRIPLWKTFFPPRSGGD
jgi:multidrug resistance efflux pump